MKDKSLFALIGLALVWIAFQGQIVHANSDAICGASMRVTDSTKTTTVVIYYTNDRRTGGTRTLCYDLAPLSPTHNCISHSSNSNSGSFSLTGLTAKSTYNYQITASKSGESSYSVCGTFTTLSGVTLILPMTDKSSRKGMKKTLVFDVDGRVLPLGLKHGSTPIIRSMP
jgi:hypothetical protein